MNRGRTMITSAAAAKTATLTSRAGAAAHTRLTARWPNSPCGRIDQTAAGSRARSAAAARTREVDVRAEQVHDHAEQKPADDRADGTVDAAEHRRRERVDEDRRASCSGRGTPSARPSSRRPRRALRRAPSRARASSRRARPARRLGRRVDRRGAHREPERREAEERPERERRSARQTTNVPRSCVEIVTPPIVERGVRERAVERLHLGAPDPAGEHH